MASASADSARLGIGQLLVRLQQVFRQEVLSAVAERGYTDLRPPHVHVLANTRLGGIRLTDLAQRSQLSLGTTSVLVTELQSLGYLDRRPDADDGRAKRIVLTDKGRRLAKDASASVRELERRWARLTGTDTFEQTCLGLQELLDRLMKTAREQQQAGR